MLKIRDRNTFPNVLVVVLFIIPCILLFRAWTHELHVRESTEIQLKAAEAQVQALQAIIKASQEKAAPPPSVPSVPSIPVEKSKPPTPRWKTGIE